MKFYIIYSIDIPIDLHEQWDEYEDMTTRELIDTFKKKFITLPFDEYEEDGSEYKETDEFYDEYYEEFREEMIEILVSQEKSEEEINTILKNNLPYYITNNLDKFYCTEFDNNFNEYDYVSIHRKFIGELDEEDFLNFIREYEYYSTCNTMGALTEYGHLSAFCVEITNSNNIEDLYVSVLFDEELNDDVMEAIENQIREAIEEGNVNKNMFNLDKD